MKTLRQKLWFLCLLYPLMGGAGTAEFTHVKLTEIFIPAGLTPSEEIKIVISGYLPNLCEKRPIIEVVESFPEILIKVTTLRYDGNEYCPQAINPFTEVINLGRLNEGLYTVHFNRDTRYGARRTLQVESQWEL